MDSHFVHFFEDGTSLRWLFFRKCDAFFKSPNLQKKIFRKAILSLKFKFPAKLQYTVIGGKFKFQVQDSFLEYFFWRFKKHIALSEKTPPLVAFLRETYSWNFIYEIFSCSKKIYIGHEFKNIFLENTGAHKIGTPDFRNHFASSYRF